MSNAHSRRTGLSMGAHSEKVTQAHPGAAALLLVPTTALRRIVGRKALFVLRA